MNPEKRKRLAAVGWVETSLEDLLGLSPAESKLIDLRIAMSRAAKAAREQAGLTQGDIAKIIKTSQPRVAKAEQSGRDVSLDAIARCLLATGAEVTITVKRSEVALKKSIGSKAVVGKKVMSNVVVIHKSTGKKATQAVV